MKESINFDMFVDNTTKHILKTLSIPVDVLKIKFAKEPTLSKAILKARRKDQAMRYSHSLQITDIIFKDFLKIYVRQIHSQYRHMWE